MSDPHPLIWALTAGAMLAFGGLADATEARTAPAAIVFAPRLFRWDEDYSALKGVQRPLPFPLTLKYLPLKSDGDIHASLGGEYRLRIDSYDRPDFGLHNAPSFTSLQQRFFLHADVHLGSDVRVFVQFSDATESGRKPFSRPFDRSRSDLAQAFVDVKLGQTSAPWRLRIGRQEVAMGRYVAVREGTNLRRAFDGVRLDGSLAGWSLTGLAARPTRTLPGAFDDDPDPRETFFAVTAEHPLPLKGFTLALAALDRNNHAALYAPGPGREERATLGARLFGSHGPWDMDGQVSYQFGIFRPTIGTPLTIDAWGAAFEGGRTFASPWSPRVAIRIDYSGGDGNGHDRRLGTFDLPYPNLSYLTDATLFAPRNVRDIQPFIVMNPTRRITVTVGAEALWRNSSHDAVFSAINTPLIPPGAGGDYIATQPYLRFDWRINAILDLQGGLVHAIAGGALRSAGGRSSVDFAFTSLAARF